MREFKELTLEEKQELAKYLIGCWDYRDNDDEDQNWELEKAYNHAINNIADGKKIYWKKTPSNAAEDLIYECAED